MALDSAPYLKKKSNLAFAIQATTGVPFTLTATQGVTNIFGADIKFNTEDVERDSQGNVSPILQAKGARSGVATFETELVGAGTSGQTPSWVPLMQCCGCQLNGMVITPLTSPTNVCTIALWIDGRKRMLSDCMGTFQIIFKRGQKARIKWTFTGVQQPVINQANILPTYLTSPKAPRSGSSCLFASQSIRTAEFTFDIGNVVSLREDPNSVDTNGDPTGYRSAMITGRKSTIAIAPEAFLLSNFDPFAAFNNTTQNSCSIGLGTQANNTFALAASNCQIIDPPADADRNGLYIDQLKLLLERVSSAGDDEFQLTLS